MTLPTGAVDFLIHAAVVVTQLLIARLFFLKWRTRMPLWASRTTLGILSFLWFAIFFEVFLASSAMTFRLRWIPPPVRSTLVATANLWGITAVASLIIYYVFRWLTGTPPPAHSPGRRTLIHTAGTAAVAAPFAFAGFGAFVERTSFHVKEIDLPIPGLHPDLEGFRIGQLSDLHVSLWLSVRDAGRTVDMLNELKPNLTVVTGDLITQVGDPLDETIRELARLRADTGVLGCLGNHEVYARCEDYATAQAARYGMDFLRARSRQVRWGSGVLNVAGVDYEPVGRRPHYLRGADRLILPGATNLLLSHNPDVFPVAAAQGYDAVLSGHTHGGQVTVEILNQTLNLARFVTPFVAGLYRLNGKSCYVTAGIGTIGMPVRIGAPPEITLLRLKRDGPSRG